MVPLKYSHELRPQTIPEDDARELYSKFMAMAHGSNFGSWIMSVIVHNPALIRNHAHELSPWNMFTCNDHSLCPWTMSLNYVHGPWPWCILSLEYVRDICPWIRILNFVHGKAQFGTSLNHGRELWPWSIYTNFVREHARCVDDQQLGP